MNVNKIKKALLFNTGPFFDFKYKTGVYLIST